jgi:hypothetical protein
MKVTRDSTHSCPRLRKSSIALVLAIAASAWTEVAQPILDSIQILDL